MESAPVAPAQTVPAGTAPVQTERTARRHARRLCRQSRSSFLSAMSIMPTPQRRAMYAIYAWCREVDDIADGPLDEAGKMERLAACRREVEALYADRPKTLLGVALRGPVAAYRLQREDFIEVVRGMESDAAGEFAHAPDRKGLERYCDRVAGAVGRLSLAVSGYGGEPARRLARHLGRALQMTNILRDVSEDEAQGRVYIPAEFFSAGNGTGICDNIAATGILSHPALTEACASLAAVAESHYGEATAILEAPGTPRMPLVAVTAAVYGALFRKMQQQGWKPGDRVSLSRMAQVGLAVRHGLL